jgi:hypothetical protein
MNRVRNKHLQANTNRHEPPRTATMLPAAFFIYELCMALTLLAELITDQVQKKDDSPRTTHALDYVSDSDVGL